MDVRVELCFVMLIFWQYILTFFLYLGVTLKEKQVKWFILAAGIYAVIETRLIIMPGSGRQFLLSSICEIVWLNASYYLFMENFVSGVIRSSMVSWIANALSFLILKLVDPEGYVLLSAKQLNEVSWKSTAVFCIGVAGGIILQYPVMKRLFRYRPRLQKLYTVIGVSYFLFIGSQLVVGYQSAEEGGYAGKVFVKLCAAAVIIMLLVWMLVWIRHQSLKLQRQQLQNRMDMLDRQYRDVAERNRKLYRVRHELGKQMEAMRNARGYISEGTREKWMNSLEEELHGSLAGLSLSGNLMLDTLIEKKKREFAERSMVLETILEPVRLGRKSEEIVAMVQEEMFHYADRFRHAGGWARYNLRFHGRMVILMLEIDIGHAGQYRRNWFLNLIGDRWAIRRAFAQAYAAAAEYDGCVDYELKREQAVIGVMLRLPEEL